MSDSNPVVLDTVLCQLQIALNLSRTPCLGYKTFLLDTSIRIQTFNYDCNYLVSIAISTSITEGNTAVYNNFLDYYICKIVSVIFIISNVVEIFHCKQNLTRKCIETIPTFKYTILYCNELVNDILIFIFYCPLSM